MSKRRSREKHKGRASEGGFFRLTHFVLRSDQFQHLSPRAKAVFLALAAEYNGNNNGSLALPRSQLAARGFGRSGAQAAAGLRELITAGFVVCTRPGKLKVGPSFYALTIAPIDASDKHPFPDERVASHLWRQKKVCTESVQMPERKPFQKASPGIAPRTETVPADANSDPNPRTETVHLYRSTKRSGLCAVAGAPATVAPDVAECTVVPEARVQVAL